MMRGEDWVVVEREELSYTFFPKRTRPYSKIIPAEVLLLFFPLSNKGGRMASVLGRRRIL